MTQHTWAALMNHLRATSPAPQQVHAYVQNSEVDSPARRGELSAAQLGIAHLNLECGPGKRPPGSLSEHEHLRGVTVGRV
jgi:hypothetical protein